MMDSGLLQTFSIARDQLAELLESPDASQRDANLSNEPLWNKPPTGGPPRAFDKKPEYSLAQLKPSLAGVQIKAVGQGGSIPHVASSSALRSAGGAASKVPQGDLSALNDSALELRFPPLPSRQTSIEAGGRESSAAIRERFWRDVRNDVLCLEDNMLEDGSRYAGLEVGVVDQEAGQLNFEYKFTADPPSGQSDWNLLPADQTTGKLRTLVVSVLFPADYPKNELQPVITANVQASQDHIVLT